MNKLISLSLLGSVLFALTSANAAHAPFTAEQVRQLKQSLHNMACVTPKPCGYCIVKDPKEPTLVAGGCRTTSQVGTPCRCASNVGWVTGHTILMN